MLEINAVRSHNVVSFLCYFHWLQANERKCRKLVKNHKTRVKILDVLRALKKCKVKSQFRALLNVLKATAPKNFVDYFQATYICSAQRNDHTGPYVPDCLCAAGGWADIGQRAQFPLRDHDETTNLIEHFFKKFKYYLLNRRIHRRLSDLHQFILDKVIPHYTKDAMMKMTGRITSHHQHLIDRRHLDVEHLLHYDEAITLTDSGTGQARVHSMSKLNATHMICLAEMRCTCIAAAKKDAVCKHLEAAFSKYRYNQYSTQRSTFMSSVNSHISSSVNDSVNDTVNDTLDDLVDVVVDDAVEDVGDDGVDD